MSVDAALVRLIVNVTGVWPLTWVTDGADGLMPMLGGGGALWVTTAVCVTGADAPLLASLVMKLGLPVTR